jgi:antitoxin ParD1/3/4
MNMTIGGELTELVQEELATGQYSSSDEVLLTAIRLLRDRSRRLDELRKEIQPSLDRLDRGEGEPLDMPAIKAEARRQWEQGQSKARDH